LVENSSCEEDVVSGRQEEGERRHSQFDLYSIDQ
jgi:hypothetical protein